MTSSVMKRLLWIGLSILIGIFTAELIIHLYVESKGVEKYLYYETEDGFFWELKPKQDLIRSGPNILTPSPSYSIKINQAGLRGEELSSENKRRILCLGDSDTFGQGVNNDETYPANLQKLLNGKEKNSFEIINAGVGGWSTAQELIFLKRRLKELSPEILVIQLNGNDHSIPSQLSWRLPGEYIIYKSYLSIFLRSLVSSLYNRYISEKEDWSFSIRKLREMINLLNRYVNTDGMRVVFFSPFELPEEFLDVIREEALNNTMVNLIDCPGIVNERKYSIPVDEHPTPEGQAILAGKLEEYLEIILYDIKMKVGN